MFKALSRTSFEINMEEEAENVRLYLHLLSLMINCTEIRNRPSPVQKKWVGYDCVLTLDHVHFGLHLQALLVSIIFSRL